MSGISAQRKLAPRQRWYAGPQPMHWRILAGTILAGIAIGGTLLGGGSAG